MSPSHKLAFKLAGVYILVEALLYLPQVLLSIVYLAKQPYGNQSLPFIGLLIAFVFLIAAAVALMVYAHKAPTHGESASHDGAKSLAVTGIAIAGLFIAAMSLRELPILITQFVSALYNSVGTDFAKINITNTSVLGMSMQLLGSALQFALGAVLFFKSHGVATRFIRS